MKDSLIVLNLVREERSVAPDDKRFESLTSIADRIGVDPKKLADQMNSLIEMFEHVKAKTAGA